MLVIAGGILLAILVLVFFPFILRLLVFIVAPIVGLTLLLAGAFGTYTWLILPGIVMLASWWAPLFGLIEWHVRSERDEYPHTARGGHPQPALDELSLPIHETPQPLYEIIVINVAFGVLGSLILSPIWWGVLSTITPNNKDAALSAFQFLIFVAPQILGVVVGVLHSVRVYRRRKQSQAVETTH